MSGHFLESPPNNPPKNNEGAILRHHAAAAFDQAAQMGPASSVDNVLPSQFGSGKLEIRGPIVLAKAELARPGEKSEPPLRDDKGRLLVPETGKLPITAVEDRAKGNKYKIEFDGNLYKILDTSKITPSKDNNYALSISESCAVQQYHLLEKDSKGNPKLIGTLKFEPNFSGNVTREEQRDAQGNIVALKLKLTDIKGIDATQPGKYFGEWEGRVKSMELVRPVGDDIKTCSSTVTANGILVGRETKIPNTQTQLRPVEEFDKLENIIIASQGHRLDSKGRPIIIAGIHDELAQR